MNFELEGVGFARGRDFTTGIFLESVHSGYRRRIATIHHPLSSPNPPLHLSKDFLISDRFFPCSTPARVVSVLGCNDYGYHHQVDVTSIGRFGITG